MEGIPVPICEVELDELVRDVKDHVASQGILVRTKDNPNSPERVVYGAVSLFPSPVPRTCFNQARRVQTDFNLLMHRVAHDYHFLHDCLKNTLKVDSFIRRIWGIYETVRAEGISQPVCLALNRSDYMFNCDIPAEELLSSDGPMDMKSIQIKQTEFNTIAAGMGSLSSRCYLHHRYMLRLAGYMDLEENVPVNDANDGLAEGVYTAWKTYGNPKAAILFMPAPQERYVYDQRALEYGVRSCDPSVKVIRRSLQDLVHCAQLTEDLNLLVNGLEIGVIYYRSGYSPETHTTEKDWAVRLLLERSRAIKCPTVYYQLAGTKKVQQVLARPGMLERFISDPEAVQRIRATFTGLYGLDPGDEGDKAVKMALDNPECFVLKPQREGGGNNLFGDKISKCLSGIKDTEERNAYILMDRIHPALIKNYGIWPDHEVTLLDMASELGIFGMLVGSGDNIILNSQHGYLLRTKVEGIDEGSFSKGSAVLDSPLLI